MRHRGLSVHTDTPTFYDLDSKARHQHATHEPSCPACDPAEYAAQDARHRNDVVA